MFKPGQSGNPNGRPKGTKDKITEEIREQFANLLESKLPEFEEWLTRVAEVDPAKAMELAIKISERFVPKLTQNQITGADGKDLNIEFKFGNKTENKEE